MAEPWLRITGPIQPGAEVERVTEGPASDAIQQIWKMGHAAAHQGTPIHAPGHIRVELLGYTCGLCQGAGEGTEKWANPGCPPGAEVFKGGGSCPACGGECYLDDEDEANKAEDWEPDYPEPEPTPWEDLD